LLSYGIYFASSSSGIATSWADDSTNQFATSQILNNEAGSIGPGANATSMSPVTYANGAVVTFNVNTFFNNSTGGQVVVAGSAGTQDSWLNIAVFTSN